MTCLVTDGCRLCATLIRLLCHLTSLFGLLPWVVICRLCTISRLQQDESNGRSSWWADRFEWTTIIKRFEDWAYGRLDSFFFFNYSFVRLPALAFRSTTHYTHPSIPIQSSHYSASYERSGGWSLRIMNRRSRRSGWLEWVEVEEWKKEHSRRNNRCKYLMDDDWFQGYDDPDSRYIDDGELLNPPIIRSLWSVFSLVGCPEKMT